MFCELTFGGKVQFCLFKFSMSNKSCLFNLVCCFQFLRDLPLSAYLIFCHCRSFDSLLALCFYFCMELNGKPELLKHMQILNELLMVFLLSNRQTKSSVNRHCRCFCIIETERTGSGECLLCHWLLFKQNDLNTKKTFHEIAKQENCQSPISLCSKTLSL